MGLRRARLRHDSRTALAGEHAQAAGSSRVPAPGAAEVAAGPRGAEDHAQQGHADRQPREPGAGPAEGVAPGGAEVAQRPRGGRRHGGHAHGHGGEVSDDHGELVAGEQDARAAGDDPGHEQRRRQHAQAATTTSRRGPGATPGGGLAELRRQRGGSPSRASAGLPRLRRRAAGAGRELLDIVAEVASNSSSTSGDGGSAPEPASSAEIVSRQDWICRSRSNRGSDGSDMVHLQAAEPDTRLHTLANIPFTRSHCRLCSASARRPGAPSA